MSESVPLPEPDWILEVRQWLQDRDNADAAAVSAADNAALRADIETYVRIATEQDARIKVLEDALQHIERVMGPKVPPCCDGCNFEWGEALKTARAALEKP